MYEVKSDVPVPAFHEKPGRMGRLPVYPFGTMNIGDHFSVPEPEGHKMKSAASMYGIRNARKFKVKTMPDRSVMCWRIA